MRVRVRFRYNRETGEVEEFRIDDTGEDAPVADHDLRHDRAAAELGRVIERHPAVEELPPGAAPPPLVELGPGAPPPPPVERPAGVTSPIQKPSDAAENQTGRASPERERRSG